MAGTMALSHCAPTRSTMLSSHQTQDTLGKQLLTPGLNLGTVDHWARGPLALTWTAIWKLSKQVWNHIQIRMNRKFRWFENLKVAFLGCWLK